MSIRRFSGIAERMMGAGQWNLKYKVPFPFEKKGDLKGKVIVISGGTRGIGLNIGVKCAEDGAKVVILGKTDKPHPKLPGTIHTAIEDIEKAGGEGLAVACDIRFEDQVQESVQKIVDHFGGIDILINNASAISPQNTVTVTMKTFDLMHQINVRGTFMMTKNVVPHLKKAENPHVLNLSPPLNMEPRWFGPQCAYTMAKYGMSMQVLGMSEEFKDDGIAFNAIWPKTFIASSAVKMLAGGDDILNNISRNTQIMADASYVILTSCSKKTTGNFFVDDEVIICEDFNQYNVDPNLKTEDLLPDGFV